MGLTAIYQIYDKEAQAAAGPLMKFKTDAAAVRSFNDALRMPETLTSNHPQDFTLRKLGHQNDETTELVPIQPETIATGTQWVESQREGPHQLKQA